MSYPPSLLLVLFAVLCITPFPCAATGPSSATVELTPLAVGEGGVVVLKTVRRVNRTGAQTLHGTQFGWLCVSAAGVWQEHLHFEFHESQPDSGSQHQEMERFNRRTDLTDPPPSLRELIEKCGVGLWQGLDPNEGRGRAQWQPGQVCLDGLCVDRDVPMKSLAGFRTNPESGSKADSNFYHAGVAVFENIEHLEGLEPVQRGVRFEIENLYHGKDTGIDTIRIAGIVVFEVPIE